MWQASEKRYCVLNYGRMRFGFWVAEMVMDLIMRIFYILLNGIDELGLIFLDGSLNLRQ
jgi:hypothetical protein